MSGFEYRVSWQREGLGRVRVIRQTMKGAMEKKERLERLEEEKHLDELAWMSYDGEVMPDLLAPPTIERRTIGEWEAL